MPKITTENGSLQAEDAEIIPLPGAWKIREIAQADWFEETLTVETRRPRLVLVANNKGRTEVTTTNRPVRAINFLRLLLRQPLGEYWTPEEELLIDN